MNSPDFTTEQIKELAGVLIKTLPAELTCDEWLAQIAPYAEAVAIAGPLPDNAAAIEHHLDICHECREEFDALLAVIRGG